MINISNKLRWQSIFICLTVWAGANELWIATRYTQHLHQRKRKKESGILFSPKTPKRANRNSLEISEGQWENSSWNSWILRNLAVHESEGPCSKFWRDWSSLCPIDSKPAAKAPSQDKAPHWVWSARNKIQVRNARTVEREERGGSHKSWTWEQGHGDQGGKPPYFCNATQRSRRVSCRP